MNLYLAGWKNYAKFTGRATRGEYWTFQLVNAAIVFGIPILGGEPMSDAIIAVWAVAFLATIVPSIAITVRRLHDTGRSGLWYFLSFVPFIGPIWLLVLMLLGSQFYDNKYGPYSRV